MSPTYRDHRTGQLVTIPGPRQPDTIEYHQEQARTIWRNWERGYIGGEPEEIAAFAEFHYRRIRELRAAAVSRTEPERQET